MSYADRERLARSGKAAVLCVCRELSPFPGSLNETLNYRCSSPRMSQQGVTYSLNSGMLDTGVLPYPFRFHMEEGA